MDHCDASQRFREHLEYCFDYCFPGDEFGFRLTVVVGVERISGMKVGTTVPTKGSSGQFAVDKALDFIEEVGDTQNKIRRAP